MVSMSRWPGCFQLVPTRKCSAVATKSGGRQGAIALVSKTGSPKMARLPARRSSRFMAHRKAVIMAQNLSELSWDPEASSAVDVAITQLKVLIIEHGKLFAASDPTRARASKG